MNKSTQKTIYIIYQRLFAAFGPQSWWPGHSRFEVIIGAILTQNTAWSNVEKAIKRLKEGEKLTPVALKEISLPDLALLIKPAGYFNVKARRLKNFINFLYEEYQGDIDTMRREKIDVLRPKLLAVNGIGPETADSILLYALDQRIFVIDAYTERIFYRHNIIDREEDYHAVQDFFMRALGEDIQIFNEYHALIVRLGKEYCRTKPLCEQCPLNAIRYSLRDKCHHCHRSIKRGEEFSWTDTERKKKICLLCKEGH